jgi:hypothetical protein
MGDTVAEVLAELAEEGITTPEGVRGYILGHIALEEYTGEELAAAAGTSISAMNGASIAVSLNGSTIMLNGAIPVIIPNADDTRDNGIVHAIAGFLGL